MLTRQQIQRLAQRNGIGMQAQERDYVQHLVLYLLYTHHQDMVFKGGTALRLAYHGNRYSEDLDFNAPAWGGAESVQARWETVVDRLEDYGVGAEVRNAWISDVGYSVDLSFRGPLFDGRDRSKGKIRLDVNLRTEIAASLPVLVSSEYDDVRPFVVTTITREHLFAEKVRALLERSKPRDLYDLWLMLGQGLQPDRALILDKLALRSRRPDGPASGTASAGVHLDWSPQGLNEALERASVAWEQDLRLLLPQHVPYAVVRQGVASALSAAV